MATSTWLGTVDEDFNVAGNWSPSGVPASTANLLFNHQATKNLTINLNQAPSNFGKVTVSPGFTKSIGGSGNFLIADFITDLFFAGNGPNAYFSATNLVGVHVDSPSASETALVLTGTLDDMTIRRGKVQLDSTAVLAANSRIELIGGGGDTTKLVIPSGVTLPSTNTVAVEQGDLFIDANAGDLLQSGGVIVLGGSANATLIDMTGGKFHWDGSGTITAAEVRGGQFMSVRFDLEKTLTNMNMYGDATVDLSRAYNLTLTNGIRVFGRNQPVMPPGTKYTFA